MEVFSPPPHVGQKFVPPRFDASVRSNGKCIRKLLKKKKKVIDNSGAELKKNENRVEKRKKNRYLPS